MTRTYLLMALLGLIPISELRGAIPYGYFNGIPLLQCFVISVLANALVAPIGFFFLNTFHKLLDKWSFYHNLFEKTVARARTKVEEKISKYGLLGLCSLWQYLCLSLELGLEPLAHGCLD